ncbi:hypothetical protein FKW77_002040 [Venturia effusa]|uniref:Uncharacterized protein n=1 Tax=Venturia effusa TaxID=50376 RepID=A0A517LBX8_9PEZI|nr:hypothetical protein FKW77_002040 [Venturia effusa]
MTCIPCRIISAIVCFLTASAATAGLILIFTSGIMSHHHTPLNNTPSPPPLRKQVFDAFGTFSIFFILLTSLCGGLNQIRLKKNIGKGITLAFTASALLITIFTTGVLWTKNRDSRGRALFRSCGHVSLLGLIVAVVGVNLMFIATSFKGKGNQSTARTAMPTDDGDDDGDGAVGDSGVPSAWVELQSNGRGNNAQGSSQSSLPPYCV